MDNAQGVIRKLMSTLDTTQASGLAALDEAVRSCSNFTSTQQLIDNFISNIETMQSQGASAETILNTLCGIDLTNSDTGAISGSDAGSGITRTAESIVYEPAYTSSQYSFPNAGSGKYRIISGVRVYCPEYYSSSYEQALASGLFNNGWIERSLALIQDSYGLSLTEAGNMPLSLRIAFIDLPIASNGSLTLARTNYWTQNGTLNITLSFNRYAFNQGFWLTKGTDASGYSSHLNAWGTTTKENCWDRITAHELVHAVMRADFQNQGAELPSFFLEGSAELIHGADDERTADILALTNNPARLREGLSVTSTGGTSDYVGPYAGGYMLLRYLAKQASLGTSDTTTVSLPANTGYDTGHTTLIAGAGFSGTLWLDSQSGHIYESSVTTINASQTSCDLVLVGRSYANSTIIGGQGTNAMWGGFGGNDSLTGGAGTNTYWYGEGDGSDTVTNYASGRDKIYWYGGALTGLTTSGTSVVFQSGSGSLSLLNMTDQLLTLSTANASLNAVISREDAASTLTWRSDVSYYKASSVHTDTLKVDAGTSISLANNTSYTYIDIDNVDASAASGSTILIGSTGNNVLTAGQGDNQLWGGFGGDDTLVGGAGHDRFWYGSGDGSDTLQGVTVDDVLYFYDAGFRTSGITQSGTNLVIANAAGGSLTVQDWTGASTLQLADSSSWRLTKEGSGFSTTRL